MASIADDILVRHRLSVDDYHRMGEAGVLTEHDRVELVEGEILDMSPGSSKHAGTVDFLGDRFRHAIGRRASLRVQNPVVLGRLSELQPDLSLLRLRGDYYRESHPRPEDVLLIVEVAETSARYDREIKLPLYAAAGIPEVWIVDLAARVLSVCRQPAADRFATVVDVSPPSVQGVVALPGVAVDLSGLFG